MSWKDYFKKTAVTPTPETPAADTSITISAQQSSSSANWASSITTTTIGAAPVSTSAPSIPYTYHVSTPPTTGYINLTSAMGTGIFGTTLPKNIIEFSSNGKEIVRLNLDGSVTWANDINIDEAAEAFAKSMKLGAEIAAGINKKVKCEMRDSVFNDIIEIAKSKGSLTAEELTYLLEASKIVEKLRGGDGK